MYQNLVSEEVIKEGTGDLSECVRTYKKISDTIRKAGSGILKEIGVKRKSILKLLNVRKRKMNREQLIMRKYRRLFVT